jgi:hypothetical protein
MGVYQIQGMGNINRRGVGIRYKVVLEAVELPAARLRELQLKANEGSLPTTEAETKLKLTQAKMEYLKYLALGAVMFAEKNNGSLPKDLRESFSYPGTDAPPGFLPDLFELVCQGRMSEIKDAAQTIIIREKDPVKTWDGQWMKCYAFADRHVEVHVELAGQFEAWEKARLKSVSRTFSLRHMLASEMGNDLGKILLGRVGMEARPAPDNMQLTVTAPSDVLNRVSTFVAVTDWPKRIAPGKDYCYPREDAEQAGRSFFYACSIEDIEGVTRMLAPGVLAELKGTNLTAQGAGGEEKDEELVRQLRGNWEGKEAAVRRVVLAWNRFPLRTLQVEGKFSRSPGPRYFASAAFEGAPVEWVELSFVPDRSPKTKREPHFGPEGPLMIDTLPPWFGKKEAGLIGSQPLPDPPVGGDARAGDTAAAQVARLKLEAAQAALAIAKALYDAGTASATEYRAARLAKDIAEGELRGDTAAILRAKLQFAEEEYVQAETKDKHGLATIGELDKAKLAKEVAEANLAGDPVAAARAELQFAEGELRRAKMLLEVGKVTRAEVEKARAARDIAAAELSRESGRAVKPGADGGGEVTAEKAVKQ